MIKKFILIFICILLLPCIVNAEVCNQNSVKLQSIKLKEKSEYIEELTEATIDNNKIILDLKMYNVGDYIVYTLKVKNESDENYYFDENSLNIKSNYFDYSLSYKDNSNKIEPNTLKTIYLRVEYKREVEKENFFSGKYKDNNIVSLLLTDNKKSVFTNPLTGSNKIIILLISMIILGIYLYYKKTNNLRLNIFIIIGLSLLIPISTYALCEVKLDINSNITIGKVKPNPCTYDGELVQGAEYVNGQYTYRYMQEGYGSDWKNIENDGWGVKLTDKESTDDVTTKLCTSINDKDIVSMSYMFRESKTSNIDLSSFNTSSVVNMSSMFYNVQNVKKYDLSSFDTSNVVDMEYMFEYNTSLEEIDVHYFDTSSVTNMRFMFCSDNLLKNLDLSNFDTHNVKYISYALGDMPSLENVNIDNWNFESFTNSQGLVSAIISGSNNIKSISMKNLKIPENFESGSAWIQSDKLESIDVTNWDLSKTKSLKNLFANVHSKEIKGLETWDMSNIEDISYMFYGNNNLEMANLSTWNTPNLTNMYDLFYECSSLKKMDLSSFDTSNVTNMSGMFEGNLSLEKVVLDNFDLSKVTYFPSGIVYSTPNLKEVSLKKWKLPEKATFFGSQFSSSTLEYIDVTGWDLSKTKDINNLFPCSNTKKYIGLETWDTSNIENMSYVFDSNNNIETLDLSSWDTSKVTNMEGMFCRNPKLKTIYVSDKFKTDNLVGYGAYWLFNNSPSLVGGNGTVYDSNHVNKEYARIDTPEAPGYFTRK